MSCSNSNSSSSSSSNNKHKRVGVDEGRGGQVEQTAGQRTSRV